MKQILYIWLGIYLKLFYLPSLMNVTTMGFDINRFVTLLVTQLDRSKGF